jgi:hypothetical protein
MCVRRTEPDDANLEKDLYSYFVNVMNMDAVAARQAAAKWMEHIARNEEPE